MFRVEVEQFPRYARGMRLEDEVAQLREEVARLRVENQQLQQLREQLAQALALNAQLQAELERLRTNPPSGIKIEIKSNTPKPKDTSTKQPRRKRAKEQNGARRRETPTQIVRHTIQQCPSCRYPLSRHLLSNRRQVIELPPPQPVEITEHQVFKSWCARCHRWHYAPLDLSGQVVGRGRSQSRMAEWVCVSPR